MLTISGEKRADMASWNLPDEQSLTSLSATSWVVMTDLLRWFSNVFHNASTEGTAQPRFHASAGMLSNSCERVSYAELHTGNRMKRAVSCCLPVVAAAAYGRLILEEPG